MVFNRINSSRNTYMYVDPIEDDKKKVVKKSNYNNNNKYTRHNF